MLELKPGLWIEVEFRHDNKDNQARRVMVMRPVDGPDAREGEAFFFRESEPWPLNRGNRLSVAAAV